MEQELLYTQEDIDEWMRTCEELQENLREKRADIQELEKENKQLKEQLAEKETFIKELQRDNGELRKGLNKSGLDYFIKSSNSIRKQVCDEILKELQENTDCYFEERECNSPHSQLPYIWFNEIRFRKFLDQIEQAKEK